MSSRPTQFDSIDHNLERRRIVKALEGWTITQVQFASGHEGGLTLHLTRLTYRKIVTLGYTELGEWLEYEGE